MTSRAPSTPARGVPTREFAPHTPNHRAAPEPRPATTRRVVVGSSSRITAATPETRKTTPLTAAQATPRAVRSRSFMRAAMRVPGPSEPQGTATSPSIDRTAARNGSRPRCSSSGTPTMTPTPKPVTDSANGTTPCTTSSTAAVGEATIEVSQPAMRPCAPHDSSSRASMMPPARMSTTSSSVGAHPNSTSARRPGASGKASGTRSAHAASASAAARLADTRPARAPHATTTGSTASTADIRPPGYVVRERRAPGGYRAPPRV